MLNVSIPKAEPFTVKALTPVVKVKAAVPDDEVKFKAPVVWVNPFCATKVPEAVMVPVLEVEIFPEVVTLSPENTGERVVPDLSQNPDVPPVDPIPIDPKQVKLPFVEFKVQPFADDPPAK